MNVVFAYLFLDAEFFLQSVSPFRVEVAVGAAVSPIPHENECLVGECLLFADMSRYLACEMALHVIFEEYDKQVLDVSACMIAEVGFCLLPVKVFQVVSLQVGLHGCLLVVCLGDEGIGKGFAGSVALAYHGGHLLFYLGCIHAWR